MQKFTISYEIVTWESAEHADAAERGYCDMLLNQYPQPDWIFGDAAAIFKASNTMGLPSAELSEWAEDNGFVDDGTASWETSGPYPYFDLGEITYHLHRD